MTSEEQKKPYSKQKEVLNVTEREEKLLQTIRNLGFGEIVVYVSDAQPVRLEEIKKSIKL